ncbi:MAG TPA: catalase family peroxidase [Limnobacter sp.]|nr:catalase family peroxidase [Limnobacter sp.]
MKTALGITLAAALAGLAVSNVATAQNTTPTADPVSLVDALEGVFGTHAGFRRSGARGVCAEGTFTGNRAGAALSKAVVFNGKPVPVTLRFSVGGGNPNAPENAKGVRGLSAQFDLPNGEQWLMANISAPFFTAATPEGFLAFAEARRPDPATGKPNPDKIAAAAAKYPDYKPQMDWIAKTGVPASYAAVNYWGVNAFMFTNSKGQTQAVRWMFEPVTGQEFVDSEKLASYPKVFLEDELKGRVSQIPVVFNMVLQLAEPGDPTNNATVAWPDSRKKVVVGQLKVNAVTPKSSCDNINFNPLVLPTGMEGSDDPLLAARAGSYAVSQGRRLAK